jgi:ABC-type lipoprotein export system ATPase subunit
MEKPTAGKIILNEIDVTNANDNDRSSIRLNDIGFLFQFYFKKIAKSLESIGQIHKDLDEIRATMDKLILFREEFLLMKNELEKAVNAINSIKEIEHKISLIDQSQKTQWARYDTLKDVNVQY